MGKREIRHSQEGPAQKQRLQREIDHDTTEFLRRGGKITVLDKVQHSTGYAGVSKAADSLFSASTNEVVL